MQIRFLLVLALWATLSAGFRPSVPSAISPGVASTPNPSSMLAKKGKGGGKGDDDEDLKLRLV